MLFLVSVISVLLPLLSSCGTTKPAHIAAGSGVINSNTVEQYDPIAVFTFTSAPGAPTSGAIVSSTISTMMGNVFHVIEREKIDQIFQEQRVQLQSSDEKINKLTVGKIAGAKAVVVGEILQWESSKQFSKVSLSLRFIDVESGQILFQGYGSWLPWVQFPPEAASALLIIKILRDFSRNVGWGVGTIGASTQMQEEGKFVVTKIKPGTPAEQVGMKEGDVILSCNGSSAETWRNRIQAYKACKYNPGDMVSLEVARSGQHLRFNMTAFDLLPEHLR